MKALSVVAVALALLASAASAPAGGRESRSEGDPRWSPDGRSVLFTRLDEDGKPALWVAHVESSETRRLRRSVSSAAWSPDGRWIVWDTFRRTERNEPRGDIHVMRADGGRPSQLTRGPALDLGPLWTADSARVLWTRWEGRPRLWSMRRDGRGKRMLLAALQVAAVDLAPDGWRLAFTACKRGCGLLADELYVAPLVGGRAVRIVRARELTAVAWSPNGRWIAFSHPGQDGEVLELVRPDGSGRRRLLRSPAYGDGFSWSPNSRTLAVESDAPRRIWLVDASTGARRRVAASAQSSPVDYEEWSPQWSPDGRWIAFVRVQGADARVFLVRPDGSGLRPLVAAR